MRKEFFGHASRLFSWTIAGQIVGLLSAPVVARIYDPEAYGIAAMVLTTGATLAIISSFRYEQAIVIADDEAEAYALQRLCRNVIATVGLVTITVCLAFYLYPPEKLTSFFGDDLYLLFGIPLVAVLNGYAVVRRFTLNRAKEYSKIGKATFSNSIVVPLGRIASGLILYGNALLLVITMVAGWATEIFRLRHQGSKAKSDGSYLSNMTLSVVAKKYRDFPAFSLPEGLLSNVSAKLPIYTLGFIYSPVVTGLYALATRVVNMPVAALSTAVSQVLLRQFEEQKRSGRGLAIPLAKSSAGLFLVAFVVGLPIMLFAEPLFRILFGETWTTTGLYAATLVPWMVVSVTLIPTNLIFVVLRLQGVWLLAQSGLFLLRIAIIAGAAVFDQEVLTTLWAFSLVSAGYYLLICFATFYALARDTPKQLQ